MCWAAVPDFASLVSANFCGSSSTSSLPPSFVACKQSCIRLSLSACNKVFLFGGGELGPLTVIKAVLRSECTTTVSCLPLRSHAATSNGLNFLPLPFAPALCFHTSRIVSSHTWANCYLIPTVSRLRIPLKAHVWFLS